jgi:hypothetical protein
MKSRRRHAALGENVDPSPFDYTLLSHLYVHSDGTDVIDFGGFTSGKESRGRVNSFLKNRSFAPGTYQAVVPESRGSYLHLRVNDNDDKSTCPDTASTYAPYPPSNIPSSCAGGAGTAVGGREEASNLVRIEDSTEHWWFMCQRDEESAPYVRQFRHAEELAGYLDTHNLHLPTGELSDDSNDDDDDGAVTAKGSETGGVATQVVQGSGDGANCYNRSDASHAASAAAVNTVSRCGPRLPLAKWLDVQVDRTQPDSAERVAALLDMLPISQETRASCLYLSMVDSIDINSAATGEGSDLTSGYVFLNLMCTPVVEYDEEADATSAAHAERKMRGFSHPFGGTYAKSTSAAQKDPKRKGKAAAPSPSRSAVRGNHATTRSVMEMVFEAVRTGAPRSSVPEAVPVGIIIFADWIFTIHDKPFAEMDDLLRMVQLHCTPPELMTTQLQNNVLLSPSMRRRFTAPFVLSVFLQIVVATTSTALHSPRSWMSSATMFSR